MDQDTVALARKITAELSELDDGLSAKMEAAILAEDQIPGQTQFDAGAAVGIASLVLGIAQFAYQILRDRKQDRKLAPEQLKRRLQVELEERGYPNTTARARVIEAAAQVLNNQLS